MFREYYNYTNNNYNKPDYNQKKVEFYDAYQGLIRGNIFPDLYNPYRLKKTIEIKPSNEQAELLTRIDSCSFAVNDLTLFLDLNPGNKEALELFNYYTNQLNNFKKIYNEKYTPLNLDNELKKWNWVDDPWPWEVY